MNLYDFLKENSIVYITRSIERALGISPYDGYHIITNDNSAASFFIKEYPYHALLIKEKEELDTYELLARPETIEYINKLKNPHIVVFKNTPQIERIAETHGWKLGNPNALLSEKIEGKISQKEWLGELASLLPPHEIITVKDLSFDGTPYIIQFNHGHTGTGTLLIKNNEELLRLQSEFPLRMVRKTSFIEGNVYTSNIVVTADTLIMGNISLQITGLLPFTESSFSTIGNDWGVPHTALNASQKEKYAALATTIGNTMRQSGWKGLFGIDVIVDKHTGELFLLEINARQPASATLESLLQKSLAPTLATIMEIHFSALFSLSLTSPAGSLASGAQIVQRVTHAIIDGKKYEVSKLKEKGLRVIEYNNTKINSDFLRIQSTESFMRDPESLNELGLFIKGVLS